MFTKLIRRFCRAWPGEKYFAEYRFLPLFLASGAFMEFVMINFHVGEVNFYKTFKKRKVQEIIEQRESATFQQGNNYS